MSSGNFFLLTKGRYILFNGCPRRESVRHNQMKHQKLKEEIDYV